MIAPIDCHLRRSFLLKNALDLKTYFQSSLSEKSHQSDYNRFVLENKSSTQTTLNSTTVKIVQTALPLKDQKAVTTARRQLYDFGSKINISFQPVFLSKKSEDELKITEKKPSIVNQQRVVYQFKSSFCDENYIGFTRRHLHERCDKHILDSSSIRKHFTTKHDCLPDNINHHFKS